MEDTSNDQLTIAAMEMFSALSSLCESSAIQSVLRESLSRTTSNPDELENVVKKTLAEASDTAKVCRKAVELAKKADKGDLRAMSAMRDLSRARKAAIQLNTHTSLKSTEHKLAANLLNTMSQRHVELASQGRSDGYTGEAREAKEWILMEGDGRSPENITREVFTVSPASSDDEALAEVLAETMPVSTTKFSIDEDCVVTGPMFYLNQGEPVEAKLTRVDIRPPGLTHYTVIVPSPDKEHSNNEFTETRGHLLFQQTGDLVPGRIMPMDLPLRRVLEQAVSAALSTPGGDAILQQSVSDVVRVLRQDHEPEC
jgi:hypothetical protein